MKYVAWFKEITKEDISIAGGKGANLGEMIRNGFPIPDGFVITTYAFKEFLEKTKLKDKIFGKLKNLDVENTEELQKVSEEIQEMIKKARVPKEIESEILKNFKKLKAKFVAVRSSATAEDIKEASFAGQQATFLYVTEKDLIEKVKACWASLYTARAIYYREQQGFKHEDVLIAVVVQKMVNSEVSGVMFTADPITGDPIIIIEAAYGLGEAVVSGSVTPDEYRVDKNSMKILEKYIAKQTRMIVQKPEGGTTWKEIPKNKQQNQKLPDELIIELAKIGKKIEEHYKWPQDIEWALEKGKLYIVQSRAITTIREKQPEEEKEIEEKPILKGIPASPGIASGRVVIIKDLKDLAKVKEGDIIVTTMTTPDMVPAMKKAAAIITDEGGMTCFSEDTYILTSEGIITISDLVKRFENGEKLKVVSYNIKNFKVEWDEVVGIDIKEDELIEITLSTISGFGKLGNNLRLTPDHNMVFFDGKQFIKKPIKEIIEEDEYITGITYIPPVETPSEITDKISWMFNKIRKLTEKLDEREYFSLSSAALRISEQVVLEKLLTLCTKSKTSFTTHSIAIEHISPELAKIICLLFLRLGILPQFGTNSEEDWNMFIKSSHVVRCFNEKKVPMKNVVDSLRKIPPIKMFSKVLNLIYDENYKIWAQREDPLVVPRLLSIAKRIKDFKVRTKISEIIESPIIFYKVYKHTPIGKSKVYTITTKKNHNFVVLSDQLTPILVWNCHAAIVSRELGIPCVVGTKEATKLLKEGEIVTVDANKGLIFKGKVKTKKKEEIIVQRSSYILTATKVKVNVATPEAAERAAKTGADGVGLLRAEHMITQFGYHPAWYIRNDKLEDLINIVYEGIRKVAKEFYPKPVWYRTFDARTDEFRHLKGGESEPEEDNPMLGWHGIRRDLDQPELLECQFKAIKKLWEDGFTNISVMIPFTIDVEELIFAKEIARKVGLPKSFKLGIMVETPACCLTIEDYIKEGIDFISFGTNDLTQLTLGIDRNNALVQKHFHESHPAILKLIKRVIDICRKEGVETSICGQAGSDPKFVEKLVEYGIDSVSANIDAVNTIREVVARTERKLMLESARKQLKSFDELL